MTADPETAAMDAEALRSVEELFRRQIEEGLHPAAAVAVYRHGRLVLDLWGGVADRESARPVEADSLFVFFSATKPLVAVCLHLLVEAGLCDLDEPVARYWPEFGHNGKEAVTIRHVLSHQGGFPQQPDGFGWDHLTDWEAAVRAVEEMPLLWRPGEAVGYHPLNFGWAVGELVRCIDGRPIERFLREEITAPLGMTDTYLGLPEEHHERVAALYSMDDEVDPRTAQTFNHPQVRKAVIPAGGGIGTARDLARFYAMMAAGGALDGVRVLAPETVDRATAVQVEGQVDRSLGIPMRWALGFHLGGHRTDLFGYNTSPRTFGHGGHGSSVGWADPDLGLGVGILTSGLRGAVPHAVRMAALSDAIRQACR